MISLKELLMGKVLVDQSPEIQANIPKLLERINLIRKAYGKPMKPSSCIRTMEEHKKIYAKKGITDESKIPMKSKHLFGNAIDISDPNQELQKWCLANENQLREIGVWMEDFSKTPNWVHFQIVPFLSFKEGGNLWFMP
jgi:uncharacterized protein YcbK (DUF882 family)